MHKPQGKKILNLKGHKSIKNKQIPWGIYVPRLIFIWGVKNGKVNQRTTGPVSNT